MLTWRASLVPEGQGREGRRLTVELLLRKQEDLYIPKHKPIKKEIK
jgi:hypothetical protein